MTEDLLQRLDEAATDTHYIDHETAREAAARIRELEAALDIGVEGAGMWRFWSKKADEFAKLSAMWKARADRAEAQRDALAAEIQHLRTALFRVRELTRDGDRMVSNIADGALNGGTA